MSKVAARFWNHKRIAQSEARERAKKSLDAMGILVVGADDTYIVKPGCGPTTLRSIQQVRVGGGR